MRVDFEGRVLPREETVAGAGIGPMAYSEVFCGWTPAITWVEVGTLDDVWEGEMVPVE